MVKPEQGKPVRVRCHIRRRNTLPPLIISPPRVGRAMSVHDIDRGLLDMAIEQVRQGREFVVGVRKDGTYKTFWGGEVAAYVPREEMFKYVIHTHPGGSPPSPRDILQLWSSHTQKSSIVVAGAGKIFEGEVWLVRKTPRTETNFKTVWDKYALWTEMQDDPGTMYSFGGAGGWFADDIGMDIFILEIYGGEGK